MPWSETLSKTAFEVRRRSGPGLRAWAGWLRLAGGEWDGASFEPSFTFYDHPINRVDDLLGWVAPDEAVGVFHGTREAAVVVMRDGTVHSEVRAEHEPLLWVLRRCIGLPSGAVCRSPSAVVSDLFLARLVEAGRKDPGAVERWLACSDWAARLHTGADWSELRARSTDPIASWCDDELFGYLAGAGTLGRPQLAEDLGAIVGPEALRRVEDRLYGPW